MSTWEPFSEQARSTMLLAQAAAQRLDNREIGAQHIAIGALSVEGTAIADALTQIGSSPHRLIELLEKSIKPGPGPSEEMVFTAGAKRVIEVAFEEARNLGHTYIGPEHIMLAYLRLNGRDDAALREGGIDSEALRARILEELPERARLQMEAQSQVLAARATLDTCFNRVAQHRQVHIETEAYWDALQRAVSNKDVPAVLLYGFVIAARMGWNASRTATHVLDVLKRLFER